MMTYKKLIRIPALVLCVCILFGTTPAFGQSSDETLAETMLNELSAGQGFRLKSYITDPVIRRRLSLTETQSNKLEEIRIETSKEFKRINSERIVINIEDFSTDPQRDRIARIEAMETSQVLKMANTLLPVQKERFQQLVNQRIVANGLIFGEYLRNGKLDELAAISKEERNALNSVTRNSRKEFREEMEKLWLEYHTELRNIAPKSKPQFDTFFGEPAPIKIKN